MGILTRPSRRTFLRSRSCLHWPALVLLVGFALAPPVAAFFFPLELEWRESTVWMNALTLRAGINLYDHSKVAFINMNHGPLDALLKCGLSAACPWLESWQVTRTPVLLLPFAILLGTYVHLRRQSDRPLFDSILATAAVYVCMLALGMGFPLVGRTDPTAFLLCALLMGALPPADREGKRQPIWRDVVAGILVAAVALTNLRYLPVAGGMLLIHFTYRCAGPGGKLTHLLWPAVATAAGGACCLLLVHLTVFGGSFDLYYRHTIGFFTAASGWPATPKNFTGVVFLLLFYNRLAMPLIVLGLGLAFYWMKEKAARAALPGADRFAILVVAALTVLSLLGWSRNYSGGGPYYLGGALFLGYFVVVGRWASLLGDDAERARGVACVLLLVSLPWNEGRDIAKNMVKQMPAARAFVAQARAVDASDGVLTEDLFFYKTRYRGERIDMGDAVEAVMKSGYYGPEFERVAAAHFDDLKRRPPRYVLAGPAASEALKRMLADEYRVVAVAPPHLFANVDGVATIWKRRDDLPR